MKLSSIAWFTLFTGTFTIAAGLIAGEAFALKAIEAGGAYGMNKIVIDFTNPVYEGESSSNILENIEKVKKSLNTADITVSAGLTSRASYKIRELDVNIIGTDSRYGYFNDLAMVRGQFIPPALHTANKDVAVIDGRLAWDLFGSFDAVGKEICILGKRLKIIGVAKTGRLFEGIASSNGIPNVYIPVETLLKIKEGTHIASMEIHFAGNKTGLYDMANVMQALKTAGYTQNKWRIANFSSEEKLLRQRNQIFLFVIGFICIVLISRFIFARIKAFIAFIKIEHESKSMPEILKSGYTAMAKECLIILSGVISVILLWLAIRFKLFLHERFTVQINRSAYTGAVQSYVLLLSKWLFYISLFIGIPATYIGFCLMNLSGTKIQDAVFWCGLLYILSTIIITAITRFVQLPLELNTVKLIVAFSFFLINAVAFSKDTGFVRLQAHANQ
jgi:hypothetical protein